VIHLTFTLFDNYCIFMFYSHIIMKRVTWAVTFTCFLNDIQCFLFKSTVKHVDTLCLHSFISIQCS